MYSAGGTNNRKCESCCVSPVQHFPLKQVLISANLSKIVRPVAKELLKTNSPLANLVTIALIVPLVIASCFSPPIFQDHTYTYIHAVDVIQLVGVHMYGELITVRVYFAFYATGSSTLRELTEQCRQFSYSGIHSTCDLQCYCWAGHSTKSPLGNQRYVSDYQNVVETAAYLS